MLVKFGEDLPRPGPPGGLTLHPIDEEVQSYLDTVCI